MNVQSKREDIRAIIVDDERLAIRGIEILLQDFKNIQVVGNADCIDKAVLLIEQEKPDLVFLDIQLQGESGFDLFDRVSADFKVVFVTAYDEYAIRAFEVNVLDYLLKPVSRKRLKVTIDRVIESSKKPLTPTQHLKYDDVAIINTGDTIKFIKLNEIICIHAENDYSNVSIVNKKDELILRTLKEWETILPEKYFIRIHRSTIINIEYIEEVERTTSNRFLIYLHHKSSPVCMSQRFSTHLKKKISRKLK